MGQTGEEGHVINLDLPNVHSPPYMVYITLKGHKIVSNPWKFMEISIHTSSKSGW